MFPIASLTLLLLFSTTRSPVKAANSPVSVPITSGLNFSNGTINLVEQDKARIQALRNPSMRGQRLTDVPLINNYGAYSILVGIGNPPRTYNLLLDSGSATTWVRQSAYVKTSASFRTGEVEEVIYSHGFFRGIEYLDYVTVGPGLTVVLQSIGVAVVSTGFDRYDGILGIGPAALTVGTLQDLPEDPIPTVTDSLYGQGTISEDVFGIFYQPYVNSQLESTGQITFGGTDPTKYNGNILYTPVTDTQPASRYWGIDQNIMYGQTEILARTAGVVDSGSTLLFIATEAYELYKAATGSEYDPATELLVISEDGYGALQNLYFNIGPQTYTLTPNAQIWPRSLNTMISGQENAIYLIVRDIGTPFGSGLDFGNGYVFMQRFYTVFDATTDRRRVGFATTPFTYATTN
ncbi:aspartic proteinase [Suillus decipiens]|nr:aspartic proteinase [Suillus decipiens]